LSFKKTLLKNIVTLGGFNYASQIATFLSSIVLSRLLFPDEYGFVALITVFTGFVTIFADAGLSFAIIRSDYGSTYHKGMNNLSFYIGVALFLIVLILAYPIAYFYDNLNLILPTMVMATTFIIGAFTIVPMAILSKKLEFSAVGRIRLIANLVSILFMILLAWLGFSYWSLIIPQLVLHFLQYAMSEYKVRTRFRFYKFRYTKVAYRKTKSLITNLSGFNLINYWARNADNLIIGKYYGNYDLGIYNRAYKMLYLALNLISGLFGTVLYPSLKKFKSEGGDVNSEFNNILGIISILNFPIGAVLILIPEAFVRILWGESWLQVAELLPFFGLLIFFQTLLSTTGHIYILIEKEKVFMQMGVISAILMVISIVIGAFYSIKMIAVCYTVGFMIVVVPYYLYYGFYKTFRFQPKQLVKFWIPKILIGIGILCTVILRQSYLTYGLVILFGIHLAWFQRKDFSNLRMLVMQRVKSQNHTKTKIDPPYYDGSE
jgi:O-antigen/teichoic acid export membrane protein